MRYRLEDPRIYWQLGPGDRAEQQIHRPECRCEACRSVCSDVAQASFPVKASAGALLMEVSEYTRLFLSDHILCSEVPNASDSALYDSTPDFVEALPTVSVSCT